MKTRLRHYKSLSFSADSEIEEMINTRCAHLAMSRTNYILALIKEDLMSGGPLVVRESSLPILPPRVGKGARKKYTFKKTDKGRPPASELVP